MRQVAVGPPALTRQSLGDDVHAAFSGRSGGVSGSPYDSLNLGIGIGDDPAAVAANRTALAAACGVRSTDLAWMRQTHSAEVCYLGAGMTEPAGPVDAMFTDVPGRVLCVLVADCVPVLVADAGSRIVGVAHAGREGMAAGVVPALIARWRRLAPAPRRCAR